MIEPVTFITGTLGAVAGFITALVTRRKTRAESDDIIVNSARHSVELIDSQIRRINARSEHLEWQVSQLDQQLLRYKADLSRANDRIRRLEDFIRLNTAFDPEEINGNPI